MERSHQGEQVNTGKANRLTAPPLKPLLLLLVIISAAVLSGVLLYQSLVKRELDTLELEQVDRLNNASEQFARQFGELRRFLELLRTDDHLIAAASGESLDQLKAGSEFLRFGRVIDYILQLRLLDSSGMERVRVDIEENTPRLLRQDELQPKGNRYYFTEALKLSPLAVYISPIDLNVEHDQIITPFQPTIRVATQFGLNGAPSPGLLIINYNLKRLLTQIEALSNDTVQIEVLDTLGYWLVHPDPAKTWGQDLGNEQHRLPHTDPALWSQLQSRPVATAQEYAGKLISYRHLSELGGEDSNASGHLTLIASTPEAIITDIQHSAALPAVLVALALFAAGSALLWREYRFHITLLGLNQRLLEERTELQAANYNLDDALNQQQQLQDDLVESRKLASLGMMVAGVSHELNTPIGGALLSVSSLQRELDDLQKNVQTGLTRQALEQYISDGQQGLKISSLNLRRASELIKSFKRVAFERSNEDLVTFTPKQVVSDLAHTLKPLLSSRQVELETDVASALEITSYPGVLSQVLQNLIVNAIEHGVQGRDEGKVRVYATVPDSFSVTFVVEDNGVGVPEAIRSHLFDPFVTTNRNLGHTGLGLHFVHQWVTQRLAGWIEYEDLGSAGGHGSRFSVTLPRELKPV